MGCKINLYIMVGTQTPGFCVKLLDFLLDTEVGCSGKMEESGGIIISVLISLTLPGKINLHVKMIYLVCTGLCVGW